MTHKKDKLTAIFLGSIIIFHLTSNYIWLKIDGAPLIYDAHEHYIYSINVFRWLKDLATLSFPLDFSLLKTARWHGFLVGMVTAPFYFIFGVTEDAAVMMNSAIFFTLLLLSTYGIAKELYNKKAGLLAAFILSMFPAIFNQLRIYMLDLPLSAVLAASLYFLIKSNHLRNSKNTIIFGITFFLGLSIKFNFILFIIGPLIYAFLQRGNNQSKVPTSRPDIYNSTSTLFLLCMVVLAEIFYILKFRDIKYRIGMLIHNFVVCNLSSGLKGSFVQWCVNFLNFLLSRVCPALSFFFLIVFMISLFLFRPLRIKHTPYIYLTIIVPLLVIGVFMPADIFADRYMLPSFSLMAVICGVGIVAIKNRALKRIGLISIIVFGLLQYVAISYPLDILPKTISINLKIRDRSIKPLVFFSTDQNIGGLTDSTRPSPGNWDVARIINFIIADRPFAENMIIFSLVNNPKIFYPLMDLPMFNKNNNYLIFTMDVFREDKFYSRPADFPLGKLEIYGDYLIISRRGGKEDEYAQVSPYMRNAFKEAKALFNENKDCFFYLKTFYYPDGTAVDIYRRSQPQLMLKRDRVTVLLKDKHFQLLWNDVPITVGLGLYTSLLSKEFKFWQDSSIAFWDIISRNDDSAILKGYWLHLPITQTWHIKLERDNIISVDIDMEVKKEIDIVEEQTNIMLDAKYKNWLVLGDNAEGKFPEEFDRLEWTNFYSNANDRRKISAGQFPTDGKVMPQVILDCSGMNKGYSLNIQNTDSAFKGRILQCARRKGRYAVGKYKYFTGKFLLKISE